MAFVRARFCESTSELSAFDPLEQYLLGIFSLLPAMLQTPMTEIVTALPLSQPLRDALLGKPNDIRCPLQWLEWHEQGEWEKCDALAQTHNLDRNQLHRFFTEAALWTEQILPPTN
jgi:EAL and modified HD-GYP domain-containing signal transduction protein